MGKFTSELKMRIINIAAHPDDEILGCGATMAKLSAEGHDIFPIILGEGALSRNHANAFDVHGLTWAAQDAAHCLGTNKPRFYAFPDNRFDSLDLLDIVKPIEELLDEIKPDVIFTHHANDLNIDHQITFRATLTAARPMQNSLVQEILCFETPSSTEWNFGKLGAQFNPSVFYDVSYFFDAKIQGLKHYENEMREFPHPRSFKTVRSIAENWGSAVGYDLCEAFELVYSRR